MRSRRTLRPILAACVVAALLVALVVVRPERGSEQKHRRPEPAARLGDAGSSWWPPGFRRGGGGGRVIAALTEPGTVQFVTSTGKYQTTRRGRFRAIGGNLHDLVASFETNAPGEATVDVMLRRRGDGTVALHVNAPVSATSVVIRLPATSGERFFGMGERYDAVDHRGRHVENRVVDGPWPPNQAEIVKAVIPEPGFSDRPDATYFPVPWVLSSAGYGVLVDNDETSRFTFPPDTSTAMAGDGTDWRVEVDARAVDLRVFAGPEPADALARMTDAIGRQPQVRDAVPFGPWWQPTDDEEAELATLRAAGVPITLAQTYTHYLPCGDHEGQRERERARTKHMHEAGLAVTTYVNPMVCVGYREVYQRGAAAGAFTLAPDGSPLRYHYSTADRFEVAQIDFSGKAGPDLFAAILDQVVQDGFDGWMEDFGEYTPIDAISNDGTPGSVMHNRYAEQYHAAALAYADSAPKAITRFNRSGWTGAVGASSIVWGGDPTSGWDEDGLRAAVRGGIGMGLSGISLWGSDIGGFMAFSGDRLTPELLNRWIEFGAFSGVMKLQAGEISIGGGPRSTVLDPDVLSTWRRYSQIRTQLHPYIAGAQETYDRTGLPIMRHLVLGFPGDTSAVGIDDQYLFGADLLVAPVLEPGDTTRQLYLPKGKWIDVSRSVTLDDDGVPTLGAAVVRPGGRRVTVPAPIGEIPLHLRAGAVLPLLPADVDTLAPYGAADVVRLRDRDEQRTLLAFPGTDWSGPLGPGETMRSTSTKTDWTLAIDGANARTYELQASMIGLGAGFKPCKVSVHDKPIEFRFDDTTGVLRSSVAMGASGSITVAACR
ncbi:MAG: TIM-barrel domain-containing protein [Aquihabitans sp.]